MSRRNWFILIAAVLFIGVDVILLVWWFTRPTYSELPLSFDGSSDQLQHTVIVPTLDTPIPEGKNAIWCASFQIAWNKLKTDVTKGPVLIQGAEEIAERLNKSSVTEADLPEGSYYAAAGLVRDGIVERIQRAMAERFPRWPVSNLPAGPEFGAVTHGYLEGEVRFETLFEELSQPISFRDSAGRTVKVSGFGIEEKTVAAHRDFNLRRQVKRLAVKSQDEFALELLGSDPATRLIVVRVPNQRTLSDCWSAAERLIAERAWNPTSGRLSVPTLHWRILHRCSELEGRKRAFLNPLLADSFLAIAIQDLRFRLDRSGASVQSEAMIAAEKKADASPIELEFNRPFLIVLKKRDAANPFFVMWVDNAELLQKWNR
jgi:hypothetical protein